LEFIDLNVMIRNESGKGKSRSLRREGKIPAVLYGPKIESQLLFLQTNDLEKILKVHSKERVVLNLIISGKEETETKYAMIKELQSNNLTGAYIHVDFYAIDLERHVTVKVPVKVSGKSKGVENGGILQIVRRNLEVKCLPTQIPKSIPLDITQLGIGQSIHVEDIALSEGLSIPHDVNYTVVAVIPPKGATTTVETEDEDEAEAGTEAEDKK